MHRVFALLVLFLALAPATARAQAEPPKTTPAQACLDDLRATAAADAEPRVGLAEGRPAFAGSAAERRDLRALYQVAGLLAARGDEEGCRMLLKRIREFDGPPGTVTGPDGRSLVVGAQPLTQVEGLVRGQSLVGVEVRNLDDHRLGHVADTVLDPRSRTIDYLLIARGGFLGVGGDLVAVPFWRFKATADSNILVLDVPEEKLANAPALGQDDVSQLAASQEKIHQYWD